MKKAKKAKATEGEKLMRGQPLYMLRGGDVDLVKQSIAKQIDRLLASKVNAAAWEGVDVGSDLHNPSCSLRLASERRVKFEAKYGPRKGARR